MCRAILACTLVVIVNLNPFLTALPACLACTLYSWQAGGGGGGGGQGCEHKASVCTSFALTRWGACQLASWGWGAGFQLERECLVLLLLVLLLLIALSHTHLPLFVVSTPSKDKNGGAF